MHWIDWLIVLVLNGAVIGYGFYLARSTHSSSDWFLGSRALPWWGIGLSMFATNVDNADIVSVTGQTFGQGLHIITVYAIGSAAGGILASFLIVPAIYKAGFYTNAEYLEARFGPTARVLSALIQIQYRSSMLGLMIWSVYLLFQGLDLMGPVAAWVLIVGMVIFSGIYTAWGGLKSVVWTDALQGVIMMVGGVVIFLAVWNAVGGWNGAAETLAEADARNGTQHAGLLHISHYDGGAADSPYEMQVGSSLVNFGPLVVVLGWTIIGAGYWTVNHSQTMRLMGARSLWDMKMASTVGVGLSLPLMIASACLGVFGRALLTGGHLQVDQETFESDHLYPLLANTYLGVGLKGLVVAGIVSAAVSTFDSMGSALSAIFTRDIYARLIKGDGDDAHYVAVGRWATVAVLMLGFLYLPFILLQKNMLDAFTTLIPVFVTPLCTMYVLGALTSVHRRSGLIGLAVGSLYGVFALYCREAHRIQWLPEATGVPTWLTDRWGALGLSFLITSATMLIVTLRLGRQTGDELLHVDHAGWLGRSREELPALRDSPFAGKTPLWANPALFATALMVFCFWLVFGVFW